MSAKQWILSPPCHHSTTPALEAQYQQTVCLFLPVDHPRRVDFHKVSTPRVYNTAGLSPERRLTPATAVQAYRGDTRAAVQACEFGTRVVDPLTASAAPATAQHPFQPTGLSRPSFRGRSERAHQKARRHIGNTPPKDWRYRPLRLPERVP